MASYSISEIETLTGIGAHTLRVWERRYSFIKAQRTDTKIRYYDDAQLKLLLNISILLKSGFRVSQLDRMDINAISTEVFRQESIVDNSGQSEIQSLVIAMLNLDEDLFNKIFDAHVSNNGFKSAIVEMIYPFLFQVGLLWGTNKSMPAQEHFVSNLIRVKLCAGINDLLPAPSNAKKMILFLPSGESHEIGLLLANYMARARGYKTYYLGQNVPIDDVIKVSELVNADFLMSIVIIWKDEYLSYLLRLLEKTNKSILLSGAIPSELVSKTDSIRFIESPNKFLEILETIG